MKDVEAPRPEASSKKKKASSAEVRSSLWRIINFDGKLRWRWICALICSLLAGAVFPVFSIIFGRLFNAFSLPADELRRQTQIYAIIFVGLGVAAFLAYGGSVFLWMSFANKTAKSMRLALFQAILRQELGFFDAHKTGTLISHLNADISLVGSGLSTFGMFWSSLSQSVVALGLSFYYGWRMTLVTLSLMPLAVVAGALSTKFSKGSQSRAQTLEADALQIATESFAAIRTVISFNARDREVERFRVVTDRRRRFGEQAAHASGMSWAFGQASIFFSYALGFWYGSTLVADGIMSPGDVLTVFFMIIFTGMSIGQAMSALPDLARASGSALDTFRIIDRTPLLDPKDGTGIRDRPIRGDISIENLTLEYPTRPGVQVLKNLSLRIPHGQVTALVGGSGSGKTSIISVLERFYDPVAGRVILDGADLRDYDLHWLRGRISLVAQEPILFSCSIMENIRHAKPDATEEEVFHAAKMANAHDFITKLPKGYKTLVGERGGMLSGGQKQRVAIARAVLKNPAILLLDEATSALDTESERLVQEALYSLMADRTSIVVAHRLSTIQNAQQIVVIGGGSVLEAGRHEELTSRKSFYAQLFQRQMVAADTLLSQPVPPPAPLAPTIEPVGKGKEPI